MIVTLRRAIALMLIVLLLGVTSSCRSDRDVPVVLLAADDNPEQVANPLIGALSEVSPPERIQQLKPYLDVYEPQVRIASPDPDTTLTSTTVLVQLQVRDFPIYKDQSLGLGPHLHLFLDDHPYKAIYDADAPITLADLAPGTHTLRLLAVRPWGESFKNDGAYDQVTFNIFAASPQNNPDDSKPVLTYNQPQDHYGVEPILLDFHLSNTPPHLVAQADETVDDWRIRCTVNGESFTFDRWQPIYLQGFKPGKNWVKLELIDDHGNLIDNTLNTNIRVIDYQPGGEDTLSQLIRGGISLAQAKVLIDPNYEPPTLPTSGSVVPLSEHEPQSESLEPESKETTEIVTPSADQSLQNSDDQEPEEISPAILDSDAADIGETTFRSQPAGEFETAPGRSTDIEISPASEQSEIYESQKAAEEDLPKTEEASGVVPSESLPSSEALPLLETPPATSAITDEPEVINPFRPETEVPSIESLMDSEAPADEAQDEPVSPLSESPSLPKQETAKDSQPRLSDPMETATPDLSDPTNSLDLPEVESTETVLTPPSAPNEKEHAESVEIPQGSERSGKQTSTPSPLIIDDKDQTPSEESRLEPLSPNDTFI